MISALNKFSDGTIELTITIPWKRVADDYQKTLTKLTATAIIDGFRKGKAPLKKVEEKIGKTHIYEELLKILIPQIYLEAVKEHKINPIISPKVEIINLKEESDWQIKATTCQLPQITLGDYKGAARKALAPAKIWVPNKTAKDKEVESENQKLEKLFRALLESNSVTLPSLLVQDEVERMLSRLIDQTARLGLTVEQYLKSVGKSAEQLRQEYTSQAQESLKLELILLAIANKEEIKVSDEETQKMIGVVPDEQSRKDMQGPEQQVYIRQILRKRKVIDNLLNL